MLIAEPERVVPFVERIVDAHFEALAAAGPHQVEEHVAARAGIDGVPRPPPRAVGLGIAPQGEALVMLGGERHVAGAGAGEDIGPVIRIVVFGAEHGGEIEVWEIRAVDALVVFPRHAAGSGGALGLLPFGERIPVPLGVGILVLHAHRGIAGHGVHSPVNEDAELGIGIPLRAGTAVERIPIGPVAGLRAGGEGQRRGRAHFEKITASHSASA